MTPELICGGGVCGNNAGDGGVTVPDGDDVGAPEPVTAG